MTRFQTAAFYIAIAACITLLCVMATRSNAAFNECREIQQERGMKARYAVAACV
jgi:hypothetical protein